MRKIRLEFSDGSELILDNEIRPSTILNRLETDGRKTVAVKVNNEICSLETPVNISAKIEPVFLDSKEGASIYRRSLCFLLAAAAHKVVPGSRLLVGNSLSRGYYYTMESDKPLTNELIAKLKEQMTAFVNADEYINQEYISFQDACDLFEELGLTETRKQLNYRCPSRIALNTLGEFSDLYFGPLVCSTGMLKVFDLMPYQDGFLLRFPKHDTPDVLEDFIDEPKLFQIYKSSKEWGKRTGITSAASLNQMIHDRKYEDLINMTETMQIKSISDIADKIEEKESSKVVLIAGPSSSGKTTTSKKLSLQLQARGFNPKVISLDNYYVDRTRTPKDKDGNYDYECLEALDVELLNQNLLDLFAGKDTDIPCYDFHKGERYYKNDKMHLEENDILVMEGIHGLNDKLTPLVPAEKKFKIYISALTQLNLDDHNRISTSDNRLIRRIVRDSRFRGKSASATISMWDSVQRGEQLHIFPFQNNADAMLNTALDYEIAVLKVYADPLLRCVKPTQKEYAEANRLLCFLNYFSQIPATAVPTHSIIREFIGGSGFKY